MRITAAVCETERNQSCEISDPCAGVSWYKDGLKLLDLNGQAGGSEGSVRARSVESALPYNAGEYTCPTTDDAMTFYVDGKRNKLSAFVCFLFNHLG